MLKAITATEPSRHDANVCFALTILSRHTLLQPLIQNFLKLCMKRACDADKGHTAETWEWTFRGRRILTALVDHLFEHHNLKAATDVLLTGDSAGGVAVMNSADRVHELLRHVLLRYIITIRTQISN